MLRNIFPGLRMILKNGEINELKEKFYGSEASNDKFYLIVDCRDDWNVIPGTKNLRIVKLFVGRTLFSNY